MISMFKEHRSNVTLAETASLCQSHIHIPQIVRAYMLFSQFHYDPGLFFALYLQFFVVVKVDLVFIDLHLKKK